MVISMTHKIILGFSLFISTFANAQETLDVMFYNLLEFPTALPTNRVQILQSIVQEYDPEIFMVCELESQEGSNTIKDVILNANSITYEDAAFITNQSSSSPLQQNLYYKKDNFDLIAQNVIITSVRDINSYVLELKTEDQATNPIQIYIYVSHLKSSQGSANEILRLEAVQALISALEEVPEDAFVIFAGDFNVYNSNEPAYQALLDENNNITFIDPIDTPGNWNNNDTFSQVHTQSTRVSASEFGAGAGGGLDDRFDFILMSQNMQTNPQLRYVENTYSAYGNNGNCYNLDINDSTCEGTFSLPLRNNLYNMSDHLPVVMTLETEETFILNTTDFENQPLITLEKTIINTSLQFNRWVAGGLQIPFSVYNTVGQQVYRNTLPSQTTSFFSMESLEKGMYIIRFDESDIPSIKFIKI